MALCTIPHSGNTRSALADRSVSTVAGISSKSRSRAYMDLSNILAGGAQYSAWRIGLASSPAVAAELNISDLAWRFDFANARSLVVGEAPTSDVRAHCIGSNKRGNAGVLFDAAQRARWLPNALTRTNSGREKGVDVTMAVAVMEDLFLTDADPDQFDVTLLTGDQDLVPVISALHRRGFAVDVGAWAHTASPEIMRLARRFFALDDYFDFLTFQPQRH